MTIDILGRFDVSQTRLTAIVSEALHGADDGELFAEYAEAETLVYDDGKLKTASFDTRQGFGLRAVSGETSGFAHSGELSESALKRAAGSVRTVLTGRSGTLAGPPSPTNRSLYTSLNPLAEPSFEAKVALLQQVDAYLRDNNEDVRQVSTSITASWQVVEILRADGHIARDVRPLVRFNVSVVAGKGDRQERGSHGTGGRMSADILMHPKTWQASADDALRQARVNLEAVAAPAGAYDIVLGPGWPGVMLHEAVGHGLEGDFNRKGTSAFSGLIGQQVAARGVTVIDDGSIDNRRGSLSIDDEGTPSARNILIEDGILVGYMQDRQNARLMGVDPTGNGRRQSYAHAPMPRMTNTFMMGGDYEPDEILSSVKDGLYAVSFGGGQVDITSGKYVFDCTEAYRVRNGKVEEPVKGAMMIGNGPEDMQRITMLGNDMTLDPGIGMCGKQGQGVPVGVGQPTTRMNGITIGGTAV